jgi:hypothetical protein
MHDVNQPIPQNEAENLFHVDKNKDVNDDNFYLFPREPDSQPVPPLTKNTSANDVFLIVRSFKNDQGQHTVDFIGFF